MSFCPRCAVCPRSARAARGTVTELRVTVANTGLARESVRLSYTLPTGLTDAGTAGCSRVSGSRYGCAAWTVDAGARFGTRLRIRVDGHAWRSMPLSGLVRVSATAPALPQLPAITDQQGFAVLFPPGPPVAGVSLHASEVNFDISGTPALLEVRLGNTGAVDATGAVKVVLPAGVTVPAPPPGCRNSTPARTECALGLLKAGTASAVRFAVAASDQAQREAPLSGAVTATLTPTSGGIRRVQMSFRITAAAAGAPSSAGAVPRGSQGVLRGADDSAGGRADRSDARLVAISLIVASVLLVMVALALATVSLRRRMESPDQVLETAPAVSE